MRMVGVKEARRYWSALVAMAEKGDEITITRRGKPVAKLLPSVKSRGDFQSTPLDHTPIAAAKPSL